MPAAKKQTKTKESVKGLESDEALDSILTEFSEKRSQQILNETNVVVPSSPPKVDLGSKSVRRARRKEMQAKGATLAGEERVDENQDMCFQCNTLQCRCVTSLPPNYVEGGYECKLCKGMGLASNGVWHCEQCSWDAHISCYSRKKEAALESEKVSVQVAEADCPKPSLAWDPLALSGPHMAIGASAGMRNIGEVALD